MAYCNQCGNAIPDTAAFCTFCGAPAVEIGKPTAAAPPQAAPQLPASAPFSDMQKKKFCAGAIFLLVYSVFFILTILSDYNFIIQDWSLIIIFIVYPAIIGLAGIILLFKHTGIVLGIVFGLSAMICVFSCVYAGTYYSEFFHLEESVREAFFLSLAQLLILILLMIAVFLSDKVKLKKVSILFMILPMALITLFSVTSMETWPAILCLSIGYLLTGFYMLEPYPRTYQRKSLNTLGKISLLVFIVLSVGYFILFLNEYINQYTFAMSYEHDWNIYFPGGWSGFNDDDLSAFVIWFVSSIGGIGALLCVIEFPRNQKERKKKVPKNDGMRGAEAGYQLEAGQPGYRKDEAINSLPIKDGYINMAKHVLLCIFTFGIWQMIWVYRTTEYLNRAPDSERYNPTSKLLLFIFVPFYSVYWFYRHGQRIDNLIHMQKSQNSDAATLCLVFGIIMPIVAYILMQSKINDIAQPRRQYKPGNRENESGAGYYQANYVEQLMQLKGLLDSGIITQEDFDAKKKQLLGI